MASVSVKVIRGDEIRRFVLESNDENKFRFRRLVSQIGKIFPDLETKAELDRPAFALTWKDSEGDNVVLSSDLELMEAIRTLTPGAALRVYLNEKEKEKSPVPMESPQLGQEQSDETDEGAKDEQDMAGVEPGLHRRVFCDGCHGNIRGIRYKCLTCPDYDLCSGCIDKAIHDEHPMIRIVSPIDKSWKVAFKATQRRHRHGHGHFRGSRSRSHSHSPQRCHRLKHGRFQRPRSRSHSHSPTRHHHQQPPFAPPPPPPAFAPWSLFGASLPPFAGHLKHRHGHQPPVFGRHHWPYASCPAGKCHKGHRKEAEKAQKAAAAEATQQKNDQPQLFGDDMVQQLTDTITSVLNTFGISSPSPNGQQEPQTESTPTPGAGATNATMEGATATASAPEATGAHLDPKIAAALNYMLAMGYTNEGGWLTKLLEEKRGDVSAVLDVLHPAPSW